ncbi:MAG: hypothetical protein H8E66_11070 [Planctomycetes bacterium]|nr:hypothetical protein [Planctomycetota bacterium]
MFRHKNTVALATSLLLLSCCCSSARAYTPQSPEVQAAVKRGVSYIEKNYGKGGHDKELGGICISALACYIATGNEQHPLVIKAVEQCRTESKSGFSRSGHANYSLGIALIFLGELGPQQYQPEVEALLEAIYEQQRADGAWSYPNHPTGDTSQTQYACLGMWMAHRQGINVKIPAVEKVCNWLIRTQAPNGSYAYQGTDPGSFNRVNQSDFSASMTAAGVGSMYVCGELLGFIDDPRMLQLRMTLPPAIKPVVTRDDKVIAKVVEQGRWQLSAKDGNTWFNRNAGLENVYKGAKHQQYYYMYALERYWAFRELAEAIKDPEPRWYNASVDYLRGKQAADGSWKSGEQGPVLDTAFAVLFLLRTSKATVTRIVLEQGRLTGGKGLKADMSTASVDNKGKVVTADPSKSVSELLKMLDDPKTPQKEFSSEVPDKLELSADPKQRQLELTRLRRMLTNGLFKARLTAAKTLGTVRDLGSAPALIFALSDPDKRVMRAARDSLRFMSRNSDGFNFVIGDERPTKPEFQEAQRQWTGWLLSVKPDAELIE